MFQSVCPKQFYPQHFILTLNTIFHKRPCGHRIYNAIVFFSFINQGSTEDGYYWTRPRKPPKENVNHFLNGNVAWFFSSQVAMSAHSMVQWLGPIGPCFVKSLLHVNGDVRCGKADFWSHKQCG